MPLPEAPYAASRDNVVTFVVVLCFVVLVVAVARSRRFVARQLRSFFHAPIHRTTEVSETASETGYLLMQLGCTGLIASLLLYFHSQPTGSRDGAAHGQIIVYFLLTVAFLAVKMLLYAVCNWVFFERVASRIWMRAQLLLWSAAGWVLFPVMLSAVYFHTAPSVVPVALAATVAAVEVLSFYKSYILFFRGKRFPLQNVLYLCALEAVPILLLYNSIAAVSRQ